MKKCFVNFVSLLFSKLLVYFFNFKYNNSVIPNGPYCYIPDIEKNNNKDKSDYSYYIKTCPYYKIINSRYCGCKYLGIITDDFLLKDQCKFCGENDDYNI